MLSNYNNNYEYDADYRYVVLKETLDSVLKEGGRLTHLHHIFFFFISSRKEKVRILLKAE